MMLLINAAICSDVSSLNTQADLLLLLNCVKFPRNRISSLIYAGKTGSHAVDLV